MRHTEFQPHSGRHQALGTDCTNFKMSDDFFSFRLSNIYGAVRWQGDRLGTSAMADLILVLSIFAVGAGMRLLRARSDF
jgi:hypothetical protein